MATQPNILWICTDQQRADTIHALGNSVIRTPNLDTLVAGGVSFDNAYCQNPICSPSRGSFLTGRYPRTTGLRQNGNDHFPAGERLITRTLAEAGYDCGLVGKLHLSACSGRVEPRPDDGYRFFRWSHESQQHEATRHADAYEQWMKKKGVRYENMYNRTGEVFPGVPVEYHHTPWAIDEAIEFIEEAQGPWLLSLNLYDPHPPFDPPPEYFGAYDREEVPEPKYREGELEDKPLPQRIDHHGARGGMNKHVSYADMTPEARKEAVAAYYGMVELIDKELGRLLGFLKQRRLQENTLIIFMSDHGEMLGDHGIFYKGPYFYEELVRVPLIMQWPGRFAAGKRSSALVELVDLAPTLLEVAGLPSDPAMQGASLMPLLVGDAEKHRKSVYCEYYNTHTRYDGEPIYATMYRTEEHKIVVYHGREEGELYDLRNDPDEFVNLWYREPELRHRLIKLTFDRSIFTLDPIPERIAIW